MLLNYGDHYRYEPSKLNARQLASLKALPVEDLAYSNFLAYSALMVPGYKVAPHNVLIAEHLMAVERGEITRLAIFMPPRSGKRCSDSTPILTPDGWKKHGDIFPGDYVFGPDGKPTLVTFRSNEDICDIDIEFTNGEVITTHRDHLWAVYDRKYPSSLPYLFQTQDLIELSAGNFKYRWCLPDRKIPDCLSGEDLNNIVPHEHVGIKDIRPAKTPEIGHCIKVDREDGLYLVGKKLVVTHNTMQASELFPSWYLGRNPEKQMIATTYSHDRASDVGRNVRGYLIDPLYKEIFPDSKISADSKSANKIGFVKGGNYFSVGVGGAIVGRGAHCFLIDDPIKSRLDAESKIVQKKLRNWYRSVAFTRLMPGASAIVVILTRWSFWDLPGWLLQEHKHENWVVLELPAIAVADNDPIGRKVGEALWPSEYPVKRLESIKRSIGTREWNSQYQQNPLPEEGGMLQLNWFKQYGMKDLFFLRANTKKYANSVGLENTKQKLLQQGKKLFHRKADYPKHFVKIVCSWDTAFKPTELSDPSACTVWGITNDNLYYLLWVINEHLEFPDLVVRAKEIHEKSYVNNCLPFGAVSLLIEDKASGQSLIQELKRSTRIPIIAYEPKGDKTIRFSTVTNVIESGRIFVPRQSKWLVDYQTQLIQFPLGRNDDMVDSTSQFLDYIQKPKFKKANQNLYWK